MKKTPFAVHRKIDLAISWYGSEYSFYRKMLNSYNEPEESGTLVQKIDGIYHSSSQAFVELVNSEGASIKSKTNKGILCSADNQLSIQQKDYVMIENSEYCVAVVEPVMYGNEIVAYEISVEESVERNDTQ